MKQVLSNKVDILPSRSNILQFHDHVVLGNFGRFSTEINGFVTKGLNLEMLCDLPDVQGSSFTSKYGCPLAFVA